MTHETSGTTPSRASTLGAGVIAGVLAGVVMALLAMGRAGIVGAGFWLPMKNVAATWYGVEALIGGPGVVVVGVLTHLAVSAAWGGGFALILSRGSSVIGGAISGVIYAVGFWALMTFAVMPSVNETMMERVHTQPFWFWLGVHLAFGLTLGILYPAFVRMFTRDRGVVEEEERYPPGRPARMRPRP